MTGLQVRRDGVWGSLCMEGLAIHSLFAYHTGSKYLHIATQTIYRQTPSLPRYLSSTHSLCPYLHRTNQRDDWHDQPSNACSETKHGLMLTSFPHSVVTGNFLYKKSFQSF